MGRPNSQAGVFAGDYSSNGELNVRLDGNKARRTLEEVLDVRARDRRPKLPPPVAQAGRAGAGAEREAEARPVA